MHEKLLTVNSVSSVLDGNDQTKYQLLFGSCPTLGAMSVNSELSVGQFQGQGRVCTVHDSGVFFHSLFFLVADECVSCGR